jgi:hypothetical protein
MMIKRSILIVVLLLALIGMGHATVQGQAAEEVPCLTWNISGQDYQAIASELTTGAREVAYVDRITVEYDRMIQPSTEWQIALFIYCDGTVAFDLAWRDVMRQVIRLYPDRWGHYAPLVGS